MVIITDKNKCQDYKWGTSKESVHIKRPSFSNIMTWIYKALTPIPPFPPMATIFFFIIILNKYLCICGECSFKNMNSLEWPRLWFLTGQLSYLHTKQNEPTFIMYGAHFEQLCIIPAIIPQKFMNERCLKQKHFHFSLENFSPNPCPLIT